MIYDKYDGNTVSVYIENAENGVPYTKIGAKAFLSCKNVYEIKLPETICELGDWAFAHMKELKRIIVPAKKLVIGKDVFLDCDNLKEVIVYPDNTDNQGLPYLLATCITVFKSYELLDFEMAAGQNALWCELYDKELINYIFRNDDAGFQPVIVGWFNDEGEEDQLQRYIEKVKAGKIKLSFLRLKYDSYIEASTKQMLLSYLKGEMAKPADDDNSTWKTVRDELATDIQYAKMTVENNLLDAEQILELIKYLNIKNASTEIVAYLVSSINGDNGSVDDQFEL